LNQQNTGYESTNMHYAIALFTLNVAHKRLIFITITHSITKCNYRETTE